MISNSLLPLLTIFAEDHEPADSGQFIIPLLVLTAIYVGLSVLFVFWTNKTKNTKAVSILEKARNIVTPIFILACLGFATYLNDEILTSIASSAVTSTLRGALGILIRYWGTLTDGTPLSVVTLICCFIILITYFVVTFFPQLSSVFIFAVDKRKRTARIFSSSSMNVTGKLNANVSMVLSEKDFEKASVKTKLRIMSEIYIQKRLTVLLENPSGEGKPFIEGNSIAQEKIELKAKFTFIAGEPGVGKSMFFIHYLSNYILKKSEDLVIYYDLAQYKSDCKRIDCQESELLVVLNNYVHKLYLNKDCDDKNDSFLKRIFKTNKNVIVILDSIDECHVDYIDDIIDKAFSGINNVKVMIGTRYAYLLNSFSMNLFRQKEKQLFLINGYSSKEWTTYVDTVVGKAFVKNESDKEAIKERINKDISVMFYSEYLNPFMLRAITQARLNGDDREKASPYAIISETIESIEQAKNESIKLGEKTLDIIGAIGNIKSNETLKYTNLLQSLLELPGDEYQADLRKLKEKLYISSMDGKPSFSSGVLSDFYAADCLLKIAEEASGPRTSEDKIADAKSLIDDALLGDLFEDHYDSIVQFLMLISDQSKKINNFFFILELLKQTTSESNVARKDSINKFVFTACESIYKFTAPRIKKDEKPITGIIFTQDKSLMRELYSFFYFAIKDNYANTQKDVFYNDIYRLVTVYGYHKEALEAVLDIADPHGMIYKIVSVVRDSYEACFFNKREYFGLSQEAMNAIVNEFSVKKIKESATNPTLIRYLLDLEFLSHLTSNIDVLESIGIAKAKCSDLLKEKLNGKKIPRYFPYIFDLSRYSYEFDYSQYENLFSDDYLSFKDSNSFVVLDINECHSFEASPLLSSLFITNSGPLSQSRISETYGLSNSVITSLMISDEISEINPYQFHHCGKLRYIHLFDGLKKVGEFAFIGCPRIEELIIPDTVTTLEESFIEDAFSMKTIRLPKRFTIGNYPFEECCSLETIKAGQTEKLSDGMFKGCSSLIDFNFGMFTDVKEIPDVAFSYCGSRERIDLTVFENLESIGNLAFSGDRIKEIVFPESLKVLRMNVFYNSSVEKMIFKGRNPIEISPLTFEGMNSFNKTIIEHNGKTLSVPAFIKECRVNNTDTEENGVYGSLKDGEYTIFSSKNGENSKFIDLDLDEYVKEGYKALRFHIGCFGNHEYIQSVSASSNKIKSLSRYMFEDNVSLTDLSFGDSSIEEYNEGCFTGCMLLKRVVLSKDTRIIGKQAFYSCQKIKFFSCGEKECQENVISLGEKLELIGDSAFWGMDNIEKIVIESKDVKVQSHAFSNMRNLKEVRLPKDYDIQNFENDAFDGDQEVNIIIGDEKLTNGTQGNRIGAFSSRIIKQGLYPRSAIGLDADDKEGLNLKATLENYFDSLSKEKQDACEYKLDYEDGHGSEASYWDIDYEDRRFDGRYSGKYRRLFFSKYRPPEYGKTIERIVNEDEFFQERNGYETNTAYWFKFEPLTWIDIGRNSKGERQYLSEFIIDSMEFNKTTVKIKNQPANLYEASSAKKWVDEILSGFITLDQEGNRLIGEDEEFRLAFIGKEEYERLKGIYSILKAKATNYASSQGTYNYKGDWAAYFIDGPDENNEDCELYIKPDGILYSGAVDGINADNFVIRTDGGIRPVLIITKKRN